MNFIKALFKKSPPPSSCEKEITEAMHVINQGWAMLPQWAVKHLKNGGSTEELIYLSKLDGNERKARLRKIKRFLRKEKKSALKG